MCLQSFLFPFEINFLLFSCLLLVFFPHFLPSRFSRQLFAAFSGISAIFCTVTVLWSVMLVGCISVVRIDEMAFFLIKFGWTTVPLTIFLALGVVTQFAAMNFRVHQTYGAPISIAIFTISGCMVAILIPVYAVIDQPVRKLREARSKQLDDLVGPLLPDEPEPQGKLQPPSKQGSRRAFE